MIDRIRTMCEKMLVTPSFQPQRIVSLAGIMLLPATLNLRQAELSITELMVLPINIGLIIDKLIYHKNVKQAMKALNLLKHVTNSGQLYCVGIAAP